MKIINIDNLNSVKENNKTSLCLGFFDGFHRGHLRLINHALNNNDDVSVMTFDISPKSYILKEKEEGLMSLDDKIEFLEILNIKTLYVLKVKDEIISLSKEKFINDILKAINPKDIYAGSDYSFGYLGKGKISDLKDSFIVYEEPLLNINEEKVSTSNIKKLIKDNKLDKVKELLGRSYQIKGQVVKGHQVGRTIGFPTCNLKLDFNYVLPPIGVYAGYTIVKDKKYKSIIDISTHPTINELDFPLVEAYLLDFNQDVYGETIKISFDLFFREAKKFDSLSDLKAQLEFDKNRCKNELQ